MKRSVSASTREQERSRWRSRILPHWRHLEREVLTEEEAKVLGLRLGVVSDVGLSQRQIARRLHVCEHSVVNIERRAFAKVREVLQQLGAGTEPAVGG
jgi:DNA-directed RNA polymerase sigma subunit (sigma70/sigma32)